MPVLPAPPEPTHRVGGASFTSLATPSRGSHSTSVWRVAIEPHTEGTVHRLTREEVFVLLSGTARVALGDAESTATEGDVIVVPPHTPFSLANPGDEPLVALCCLPVGGEAQLEGGQPFVPPWAR